MGRWMKLGKDVGVRNGVVVAHLEAGSGMLPDDVVTVDDAVGEMA